MPTYVRLTKLTQKGYRNIEHSPQRTEKMEELAEEYGGEIKDVHLTMGEYDFVTIAEFPDDETYAEFALAFASIDVTRTETLKAFDTDEYHEIAEAIADSDVRAMQQDR